METNLATAFILMAKFIERILPLGSVFAGVTLAVAFIESGREASRPRNLVVNLLTGASVSLDMRDVCFGILCIPDRSREWNVNDMER